MTGDAIMAPPITTMADMDKLHGKLKGKIVLLGTGPLDWRSRQRRWHVATPTAELTAWFRKSCPTAARDAVARVAVDAAAPQVVRL